MRLLFKTPPKKEKKSKKTHTHCNVCMLELLNTFFIFHTFLLPASAVILYHNHQLEIYLWHVELNACKKSANISRVLAVSSVM